MEAQSPSFEEKFSAHINFKKNKFHPLVWINGEPEIGDNVYIGGMSEINAKGARVSIGDNCDIASFVVINCADSHKRCIELSTGIIFRDIIIEHNVFIGSQSIIKGGAHIGHHSVIAAGTVVDGVVIPPYSLVSGNKMTVKPGYYCKSNAIPHNRPSIQGEEVAASARVLQSGFLSQGQEVAKFEQELCDYFKLSSGSVVVVSSGTAAIFLALESLNAKNKKVAIPAYACTALLHAANMAGADQVVFIDNSLNVPCIDMNEIIKSAPDIAIVPHMYGFPVKLPQSSTIKFIEDCAQAIGAIINGIPVGLQGDVGIFSFHATKLITSGGAGGAIISKDKAIIDFIKDYRDFDGKIPNKQRFNFQMTDLQAAVGREQLAKLPLFIQRREEIFNRYCSAGLAMVDIEDNSLSKPVRYRALLKTSEPQKIIDRLKQALITSINPHCDWELLGAVAENPNAYYWTQNLVSLPIYPSLSNEEVDKIITCVRSV